MNAKFLFLLIFSGFLFSCTNKNKHNKDEFEKVSASAELSEMKISELPLGFNFGMLKDDVEKQIKKLEDSKTITSIVNDKYEYQYTTKKGVPINYWMECKYFENELYSLVFSVMGNENEVKDAIIEELNSELDSTYLRIGYWEELADSKFTFNKWIKGNQVIFLKNVNGLDLIYTNAPIDKIVRTNEINNLINEVNKKQKFIEVKNSIWDGSVSQIKIYLKSNLKDPDSYESIEWSNVTETPEGYMVRHKYRAKNSFGGYIIENKLFYMDKKGNVIQSIDYKQ